MSRHLRFWVPHGLLWILVLPGLLAACGVQQATVHRSVAASSASRIHLPADQAAHAGAHNEWWYLVGHLRSGSRTFGYETTIFKFKNIHLPGVSTPVSVYRTDVAITDERGRRFHDQVTYHFPADAHLSTSTLDVRVGKDSISGASPQAMRLLSGMPAGSLSLSLASRRPAMDVGGNGYIGFGNDVTYYYSLTDIATHGFLTLNGKRFRVSGVSWMDHQWGNWSWSTIRGWTWMALQLNNGTQLSLFDVRGGKRVRLASILPPSGKVATVHGITITATGRWHSPHTRATYPSGWIVHIPAERATLRVTPAVVDQELAVPNQAGGSYWEGSGRISGTWQGKHVSGLSYTELTGYVSSLGGIPGGA